LREIVPNFPFEENFTFTRFPTMVIEVMAVLSQALPMRIAGKGGAIPRGAGFRFPIPLGRRRREGYIGSDRRFQGGSPMRVVVQRVSRASVTSGGELLGGIGRGLLVFAGFGRGDDSAAVAWMAEKIVKLRIFEDEAGKMNRSVADVGGGILVVSQFTLYGDAQKGNRPGFDAAARPERAEPLFREMLAILKGRSSLPVESGLFGAQMEVELVNDGPVTILLERSATSGSGN
jgi:D-tyrosyl-tRNA(Tyr) deacylase